MLLGETIMGELAVVADLAFQILLGYDIFVQVMFMSEVWMLYNMSLINSDCRSKFIFCKDCIIGKWMHVIVDVEKHTTTKVLEFDTYKGSTKVLEFAHLYEWGTTPVASLGEPVNVFFLDDFSLMVHIYFDEDQNETFT